MANDLVLSKKVSGEVSIDEARSAIKKAAMRLGKVKEGKKERIVISPKSSIHRLTITSEVEAGKADTTVVTYAGSVGISAGMIFVWIIFVLVMAFTVVGLLLVILVGNWSQKAAKTAFRDAAANAMEMIT